jgi:molecular chaperone GrpE
MSERIHTDADRDDTPPAEDDELAAGGRPEEDGPGEDGPEEDELPPAARSDGLELRLRAAEARADEHLDDLKRLAAEFDNFRKRTAREQQSLVVRAHERLVKELLPVLDDLERALEAAEQHEGAKLEEGVRLVHRALADVLRKEGVDEIPTDGRFDPHVHEALLAQPSDAAEGTVIEVLQKGYRLGDRVLRPSRVVVAAAREE